MGEFMVTLYYMGVIYQILFLLVNLILMFNFVIAILSSTFAFYEEMKLGLYYNVLNSMFAENEWDDTYGALICTKPPLPTFMLAVPFFPFFLIGGDRTLR